jgi:hypothetical protein
VVFGLFGFLGSMWRPMRHRRRGVVELKWLSARTYTTKWYPQGIDFGTWQGRRTLAVSWFRQDKTGQHLASRVTFIDLERSRHLDVALTIEGDDGELVPAQIHAGGLAWFGDRLFVAATGQGIWEFDLGDTQRLRGVAARRVVGARGRGFGAVALAAVRTRVHPVPLRCSFIGRIFDADGTSLPRVLIGEYRGDTLGRIGEFTIPRDVDGSFDRDGESSPQIARMQGAVQWGDRRFISQSRGLQPGALWEGSADPVRSDVALPIGCEDLALDPEERMLWSLGEHPWRRVVRGIPFAQLGL